MRYWGHRISYVAGAILLAQQAAALDLSLTARAEAGLDPATREFIQRLPETWRPQIAGILDDALVRVNKSVNTYLADIDALISKKLAEFQCTIVGTEKNVVDDIVSRFPFVRDARPMEDLRLRLEDELKRRTYGSSPTFIKDLYNDLMLAASLVSCQNAALPTAQEDAGKIIADLSRRWLVWNRLQSIGCQNLADCLDAYRAVVAEVVETSDQRDLDASGGQDALLRYQEPPRPGAIRFSFDFDKFENAFTQLFLIENSIGAAKTLREASAVKILNAAIEKMTSAKGLLDAAVAKAKQMTLAYDKASLTVKLEIMRGLTLQGPTCEYLFP